MNIDDVTTIQMPAGSRFKAIFEKQRELMEKYDPLERRNGAIVPDPPYDIDNPLVQMRIKDFYWRTTEEIAEALDVSIREEALNNWRKEWDSSPTIRHMFEELSDALHFLVEASIYAGLRDEDLIDTRYAFWLQGFEKKPVVSITRTLSDLCMSLIMHMGLAANCFKNKPWKNSHMPTDRVNYYNKMRDAWDSMLMIFARLGMTLDEVYVLYHKKHAVNQFRQRSNY